MNEVVAKFKGSDFEDSEDDFDRYLDMESYNDTYTNETRDGAVEGDNDNARISNYGYIRLSTHKDHSKTASGTSARHYSRLAMQRSMHSTNM